MFLHQLMVNLHTIPLLADRTLYSKRTSAANFASKTDRSRALMESYTEWSNLEHPIEASAVLLQSLLDHPERLDGAIPALARPPFGALQQKCMSQSSSVRGRNIRTSIPYEDAFRQSQTMIDSRAAHHPRPGFAIFMLPLILPNPVHRMEWAEIDGVEPNALSLKRVAHPIRQEMKVRFCIQAAANPSLIGHHNEQVTQRLRRPA